MNDVKYYPSQIFSVAERAMDFAYVTPEEVIGHCRFLHFHYRGWRVLPTVDKEVLLIGDVFAVQPRKGDVTTNNPLSLPDEEQKIHPQFVVGRCVALRLPRKQHDYKNPLSLLNPGDSVWIAEGVTNGQVIVNITYRKSLSIYESGDELSKHAEDL